MCETNRWEADFIFKSASKVFIFKTKVCTFKYMMDSWWTSEGDITRGCQKQDLPTLRPGTVVAHQRPNSDLSLQPWLLGYHIP